MLGSLRAGLHVGRLAVQQQPQPAAHLALLIGHDCQEVQPAAEGNRDTPQCSRLACMHEGLVPPGLGSCASKQGRMRQEGRTQQGFSRRSK